MTPERSVCSVRTVWIRRRGWNVSAVASNGIETSLEADSHADTTCLISLVRKRQAKYLKSNEKFGISVPRTVTKAKKLDKLNGNTLWMDAIAKEMENVKVAFNTLDESEKVPRGFTFVKCHMIFSVKMENFRRKARFVAGGHMTEAPSALTYASVVSRETVELP